jgi:GPI-anchor transamidase subunit T
VEDIGCDTSKSYHAEDSCFPLEKPSEPAWSLEQVFGRPINGDCQIADESPLQAMSVCINTHPDRTINILTDPPNTPIQSEKRDDGCLTCFKPPPHGTPFNLDLPEQTLPIQIPLKTPRLHAFRSMTGYGQEHGSIQSTLINPSSSPLSVMYLESLPWYMKPYLHTLQATLHPPAPNATTIIQTFYRPALDRHRGTHLELHLNIPPQSTLSLTYDFDKAILRYTEYPPDANRGFDVASAIIRVLPDSIDDAETRRRGIYLRTTSLLLPLPTPDFSMPYNVIILTSTVIALGFGGIFNILVRRFVAADEVPVTRLAVVLRSVVARIGGRIRVLAGRVGGGSRAKTE